MQHFLEKNTDGMTNILRGAILAITFIAFVTIGAELYIPFKNWLVAVFSHHWIGKGVLAMLIFLVVGVIPAKHENSADVARLVAILFFISLLSAVAIAGFIGYEAFIK